MRLRVVCVVVVLSSVAHAAEPDAARARESFVHGVELAKRAEWSEARVSFEASLAERPHPVTRYNLALCHRALGDPVRAVYELELALAASDPMPDETKQEASRLLAELRPERAFVEVARGAHDLIVVDARPLEALGTYFTPARTPGAGSALPVGTVHVAVTPGHHEIRVTRDGYTSSPWTGRLAAGESRRFVPAWQQQPGLLVVTSAPAGALVRVDGSAPAIVPVSLSAAPGLHRVDVELTGYQPFHANVVLRPDVRSNVHAALSKQHVSVFKRWWFWTAVVGAVAGAGVLTYALTRPDSPPDGGSLGWVVR